MNALELLELTTKVLTEVERAMYKGVSRFEFLEGEALFVQFDSELCQSEMEDLGERLAEVNLDAHFSFDRNSMKTNMFVGF